VLVQNGQVIAAPFHAACGGRTERPRDVWDDEEQPELEPVEDDACAGASGAEWSYRIPRASVSRLGGTVGLEDARFLEVFGRDVSGRVASVRLAAPGGRSIVMRGFDFRRIASALWGWSTVRSTAFSIAETKQDYVLTGRGTGHGAGLCQAGAIARARRGETREEILALYYRGAVVRRLSSLVKVP
jgi:stage II sporulation protein D